MFDIIESKIGLAGELARRVAGLGARRASSPAKRNSPRLAAQQIAEQVVRHENLAVAFGTGADSDSRDGDA